MEKLAIKNRISDLEALKEDYLSRIIEVNIIKGGQGYIQRIKNLNNCKCESFSWIKKNSSV